jgi:fumarate reductase subunit D
MKKSNEPFWWALFAGGGMLSAFFLPVLILLTGLAMPLGWVEPPSYEAALSLLKHPLTRLFLLLLISLSMFHWAHRFRFTLYDGLQLKHLHTLIAVLCYGTAIAVSVVTVWVLWRV